MAIAALVGALAGPLCLIVANTLHPSVVLTMDRNLPVLTAGFYPVERDGQKTFVWTSGEAAVTLAGLDRRVPWSCTVRFRGARSAGAQPDLAMGVDGVVVQRRLATNDFQDIRLIVPPAQQRRGLRLSLVSSNTFVPGGGDSRALGVQIEQLACRPAANTILLPPTRALTASAIAAGIFGGALALAGLTLSGAVAFVLLLAAAQAAPMVMSAGLYTDYPTTLTWLAFWIALVMVVTSRLLDLSLGRPLHFAARAVIALSAAILYLNLSALLHPGKVLVDALFHAHRLQWVLEGRYYFTQLSTSATPFPYAIGLYLFAIPWSYLTHDYVALLRIIVSASQVVAGALLYVMVVRTWNDRLAGVLATSLFSLPPLLFLITGSANLTNLFGQAVSVATMAAIAVWAETRRPLIPFVAVTLLATLAFICHVSTFALLLTTMLIIAGMFRLAGSPTLPNVSRYVLAAAVVGAVLAVVLYWGHFGDLYKARLAGLRTAVTATVNGTGPSDATKPAATQAPTPGVEPRVGHSYLPLSSRTAGLLRQTVDNLGWGILALALVGVWRVWLDTSRDPLTLIIGAWGIAWLLFVGFGVVAPFEQRYQQDAWEFIGRVELMTYPAGVLLAGRGAAWGLRAGKVWRWGSAALLALALSVAWNRWIGWLA